MLFQKKHKIGDTIAKLRKEKGWTQNELAEKLQISDKAISKWESNKGDPSLEFFPVMAKLFGVSLDYLITGKKQEEKIVTMSKLELCAKKDDVNMYKEIGKGLSYKDENNKTIFDYVFKYESKKIFTSLLSKVGNYISGHKTEFYENFYYMRIVCNDTTVIRDLIRLDYIDSMINHHLNAYENTIGYNGSRLISIPRKILSNRIFDLILYSNMTSKEIKEAMLTNHLERQNNYYSPAISFPYLIEYTISKGDFKLAKDLLLKAVEFNKNNADLIFEHSSYIGFVDIPKTTFDKMAEFQQYDLIELANKCNAIYKDKFLYNNLYKQDAYLMSNYEIEANKIKNNNKLSKKEKDLQLCIHNGIVCLDELISLNDFDSYEKMIAKYPANEYEIIFNAIKNKDYKLVFDYATQHSINNIIDSIRNKKINNIEEDFCNYIRCKHKPAYGSTKIILVDSNGINKDYYIKNKIDEINYQKFLDLKNKIILSKVLDKDVRFIEKACKTATQQELDDALTKVTPNNFKAISILLNFGAKLHKTWTEDDGWGYMVNRDEIDEIGTEILKKKIKDVLGEK